MNHSCCYILRHLKKISSIHSHSNDKQHEIHDCDTLSSADKKLAAILDAVRHTSESKSTIAATIVSQTLKLTGKRWMIMKQR